MTAPPLQISDVVKSFNGRPALDGVSLELRRGEILGLLGPNGAGKSTLVRTVMGRVRPDSGTVSISGVIAPPGDPKPRRKVGLVPQEVALYPLLTARENLAVFGRYHGIEGEALDRAISQSLEWAALADRQSEPIKNFSGGMKRRLNMAAGIIQDPEILLLDEPTVGVDPQSRERMYSMIEGLRGRGVSIIYTTHYMEEAERLCDRIAIIDHGKIIAHGTRDELVRSTIGPDREVVIECASSPPPDSLTQFGARIDGQRVLLSVKDPADGILHVLRRLESDGVTVRDFTMKAPTLERVFLHLTGRELRE